MNKFKLLNAVLVSDLRPGDKNLLVELIVRADDNGECYPSVTRLCQVRGIKHEKNFKGADYYLPGLVTKVRKGKKNFYLLNTPAIEGVTEAEVTAYQGSWTQRNPEVTPAPAEVTPADEGVVTPAVAEVTPSWEGVDSSIDTTEDNTRDSSMATTLADAPAVPTSLNDELEEGGIDMEYLSLLNKGRQDDLERKASTYGATKEQLDEAAMLLHGNQVEGFNWQDQLTNALIKVGVDMGTGDDEW